MAFQFQKRNENSKSVKYLKSSTDLFLFYFFISPPPPDFPYPENGRSFSPTFFKDCRNPANWSSHPHWADQKEKEIVNVNWVPSGWAKAYFVVSQQIQPLKTLVGSERKPTTKITVTVKESTLLVCSSFFFLSFFPSFFFFFHGACTSVHQKTGVCDGFQFSSPCCTGSHTKSSSRADLECASFSHPQESTQQGKTSVSQNTTHWVSTKCLHLPKYTAQQDSCRSKYYTLSIHQVHPHESTQHSKTRVSQNTTDWVSTKWLASPWKYTAQQDSCQSKYYRLSVHQVTCIPMKVHSTARLVHTECSPSNLHPHESTQHSKTQAGQNTTHWESNKCVTSPWKYTAQQDSCRSKYYTLSIHQVPASPWKYTAQQDLRSSKYYTLSIHQVTCIPMKIHSTARLM